MTGLPTSRDRMPRTGERHLRPAAVIAVALASVPFVWWDKNMRLSETSQPVMAVLDALDKAGLEIVEKGRK